jgi:hypothetical protein
MPMASPSRRPAATAETTTSQIDGMPLPFGRGVLRRGFDCGAAIDDLSSLPARTVLASMFRRRLAGELFRASLARCDLGRGSVARHLPAS